MIHYHIAVDSDCLPAGTAIPKADPWVHFGDGKKVIEMSLAPGAHRLTVQAGDDMHRVFISNDILYSATGNGVLVYRLKQVNSDTLRPTALINNFLINYKPFSTDSLYDLKHDQNNLSFEFGGVWTKNPDKLFFRYMLKGHEIKDTWFANMIVMIETRALAARFDNFPYQLGAPRTR